jgi:hypothetical protein
MRLNGKANCDSLNLLVQFIQLLIDENLDVAVELHTPAATLHRGSERMVAFLTLHVLACNYPDKLPALSDQYTSCHLVTRICSGA